MGVTVAEKDYLAEILYKRLLHSEKLARIEFAKKAKIESGSMAICPNCCRIINYQNDTILMRKNGNPYGQRRECACGDAVIRTTWAAIKDLLS